MIMSLVRVDSIESSRHEAATSSNRVNYKKWVCAPVVTDVFDLKMIMPKTWKKSWPGSPTRRRRDTLCPVWNHFSLCVCQEIRSLASDNMRISLTDCDKAISYDKIASFEKKVRELPPGKIGDEYRPLQSRAACSGIFLLRANRRLLSVHSTSTACLSE